MSDVRLQEIMTRAVVGRCDRRVVWSQAAAAEGADSVLGVHVSGANLRVEDENGEAAIQLTVSCDLWCSTGEKTRVHRMVCTHTEPASVPLIARVEGQRETTAQLARGIRCTRAEIREGQVELTLEAHVAMEMTGMARFWVRAYDLVDGEYSGSDDSLESSSSSDSSSQYSDDELDEVASLAGGRAAGDHPAGPPPLLPADRTAWEGRRNPVLSRFPQTPRIAVVEGH